LPNLFEPGPQNAGCLVASRLRTASHTRPLASIATLRGSADRFQASGPAYGELLLSDDASGGASLGTFITTDLFCTGSRISSASVCSEAAYTKPFAFTRGSRVSEAAVSDRPSFGVPQSHSVITRLRSIPAGRI